MSVDPSILQKIKYLNQLAKSSNPNEAANAKALAEKLITKHNLSEQELKEIAEKAPAYSEKDKLFQSSSIVPWMTQLALAIGTKFDCQIVQEQCIPPNDSPTYFQYFVYGFDEDVEKVKLTWHALFKKIDPLIATTCRNRGEMFKHSYCEGLIEAVKDNLEYLDLDIKVNEQALTIASVRPIQNEKQDALTPPAQMEKAKPDTEVRYNVNANSIIKDISAYFKGLADGEEISPQVEVDNIHQGEL